MTISRLFHTVRHLKPIQIYGRVVHKICYPKADLSPTPIRRDATGKWVSPVAVAPSMIGPCRFRFLNQIREIEKSRDWNHPEWDKLWLYNLHYFDDLNAAGAKDRSALHVELIHRWIAENPPGMGNGWEPYPLSLRIVNWIKWALACNRLSDEALHSLAVQVRYLAKRLEIHLLGNHLFANAKALVFAGLFFPAASRIAG